MSEGNNFHIDVTSIGPNHLLSCLEMLRQTAYGFRADKKRIILYWSLSDVGKGKPGNDSTRGTP